MIDFSTLQGLSIPEGAVTQVADSSGRVIWAAFNYPEGTVVLEVKKQTGNTYAGETTYTGEQFILLDIYPKTNGTVSVTYGDLTKTITDISGAEEPNAQQVFFGTFNGISDNVETPESGTLTIEGQYRGVGIGTYKINGNKSLNTSHCYCIDKIYVLGSIEIIPDNAFYHAISTTRVDIPNGVTSIGNFAFCENKALISVSIPSSVVSLGEQSFAYNPNLSSVVISNGVTSIGNVAFRECHSLTNVPIPSSITNIGTNPWCYIDTRNILILDSNNTSFKIEGDCLIEITTNNLISGFVDSSIPNGVTSIGVAAFAGRASLTSIVIPSSVTSIGSNAFSDCSGLENIKILVTIPPTCGTSAFSGSTCPITVPVGCGEAYKAAEGWSTYADRIVEAS